MDRRIVRLGVRAGSLAILVGALALGAGQARAMVECDGAPTPCVAVSSGTVNVSPLQTLTVSVGCPADYPWYNTYDHTSSTSALTVTEQGFSPNQPQQVNFWATDWTPLHSAWVDIYIGCMQSNNGAAPRRTERPGPPAGQPDRDRAPR